MGENSDSGSPKLQKLPNMEDKMDLSGDAVDFKKYMDENMASVEPALLPLAKMMQCMFMFFQSQMTKKDQEIAELRAELDNVRKERSAEIIQETVFEVVGELKAQEEKKNNFVITGLQEGARPDSEIVRDMISKSGGDPSSVIQVRRMPDDPNSPNRKAHPLHGHYPRLLKVLCKEGGADIRSKVGRNMFNLKESIPELQTTPDTAWYNRYVRPDWTRREQTNHRSLVQKKIELEQSLGGEWVVRDGRVIKRPTGWRMGPPKNA